jgi:hypothetical protein
MLAWEKYELPPQTIFSHAGPILIKRRGNIAEVVDVCVSKPQTSVECQDPTWILQTKLKTLRDAATNHKKGRNQLDPTRRYRYNCSIPVCVNLSGIVTLSHHVPHVPYWIRKSEIYTQGDNRYVFHSDVALFTENPHSSEFACIINAENEERWHTDWHIEGAAPLSVVSRERSVYPLFFNHQVHVTTDQSAFRDLNDAFRYLETLSSSLKSIGSKTDFIETLVLSYVIAYPVWVDSTSIHAKFDGSCWCLTSYPHTLHHERTGDYTIPGRFVKASDTQKFHLQIEIDSEDRFAFGTHFLDDSYSDQSQVCLFHKNR